MGRAQSEADTPAGAIDEAAPETALLHAGVQHLEAGELVAAEGEFRAAIARNDAHADACFLLASALTQQRKTAEAVEWLRRALSIDPEMADAHLGLGALELGAGNTAAAVSAYRQAVLIKPQEPLVHCLLASALTEEGDAAVAEAESRRALALDAGFPEAHNSLGNALLSQGRVDEADACFRRSLELEPEDGDAHFGLGNVFYARTDLEEAVAAYRKVIAARPEFLLAHNNLGIALQDLGDQEGARASFQTAYDLFPAWTLRVKLLLALPAIMSPNEQIDGVRQRLDEQLTTLLEEDIVIDDPLQGVGVANFYLAYHGRDDRGLQEKLALLYEKSTPTLLYVAPHCQERLEGRASAPNSIIKVGFVSTYFRRHTIGYLMHGIVAHLDRTRFHVTVFLFPGTQDDVTETYRDAADRVVELPKDLAPARERIADEQLDLLYYPDIGMDPRTYFLAFARLAPVQCVSWGHPVTTGLRNMDYFLSARDLEPPGAEAHYSEKLVRLEHLNFWFERPRVPEPLKDRGAYGLDGDRNVYLCPQNLIKLHPDFDEVLAGILRHDPRAEIVFISSVTPGQVHALRARFAAAFPEHATRVRFLPRQPGPDFINLAAVSDVVLDSFHFSGTRSTADVLATGTPIVCLRGALMRGRLTYGCYRQIGVTACIAETPEVYVDIAVRLATDVAYRAEIRQLILRNVDKLYEQVQTVRELENFIIKAVRGIVLS